MNGPIHIGHLQGFYAPSDISLNFRLCKGSGLCAGNEHGAAISIKAQKK
jgi:methionyl-tRNA synthetase